MGDNPKELRFRCPFLKAHSCNECPAADGCGGYEDLMPSTGSISVEDNFSREDEGE